MMIFKTIDLLLIGTRYLVWGMSFVGIPLSMILMLCNLGNGFSAVLLFFAALLLSSSLTLLLLPKELIKNNLLEKSRLWMGGIFSAIATLLAGIAYMFSGGFPVINLLFI